MSSRHLPVYFTNRALRYHPYRRVERVRPFINFNVSVFSGRFLAAERGIGLPSTTWAAAQ